jgi:hypothetical protein
MKTIMITMMMMVGMIGFSQQNEKSMSTVQEGDSIIFKSMRCTFTTFSGKIFSFKGTLMVNDVSLYEDGTLLGVEVITDDGTKYDLTADMLLYYEAKNKVEVCSE